MKHSINILRVLLFSALVLLAGQVSASDDHERARELVAAGDIVSIEQILQNIPYKNSRILELELEIDDSRMIYELELLTQDGVVRELKFDAKSGKLLKDEKD